MPGKGKSIRSILVFILILCPLTATSVWSDTIHVGESIGSDTTWTAAGNDHIVVDSLRVEPGAILTIEDGCNVHFEQGVYLSVDGTLNAPGTPGGGILFTRRDVGDAWYGLQFNSGSDGTLQYCTVEHATGGSAIYANSAFPTIEHCTLRNCQYGIRATNVSPVLSVSNTIQDNIYAGLYFTGCTNPSISNQIITGHTNTYGAIRMASTGEFHIGTGNVVTGNSWGLTMDMNSYPDAASSGNIPMSGNTNDDGIQVNGGGTTTSIPWRDVEADYIVTTTPSIQSTGTLTIEDGCTVRFESGRTIYTYGILNAPGTPGGGILFTRRDVG
ncbi:right-handed parallel beta-helix repeat-containing protein, partial [Candidatus Eisenbacteria bacterium]